MGHGGCFWTVGRCDNSGGNARPLVVSEAKIFAAQEVVSLGAAGVAHSGGVMVALKEPETKFIVIRDVDTALVTEPAVVNGTVGEGVVSAVADAVSKHL